MKGKALQKEEAEGKERTKSILILLKEEHCGKGKAKRKERTN